MSGRRPGCRKPQPTEPAEGPFERILLASEGRPISDAAIARAVELARPSGASVRVFSIARVHGVAFGMQSPGLLPTKREWAEQREIVGKAVKRLERKGIEADGHVLGTRKSTKRILRGGGVRGMRRDRDGAPTPTATASSATCSGPRSPSGSAARPKIPVFLVFENEGLASLDAVGRSAGHRRFAQP